MSTDTVGISKYSEDDDIIFFYNRCLHGLINRVARDSAVLILLEIRLDNRSGRIPDIWLLVF